MDIKGIWKKTTQSDGGSRYPAQIEFMTGGTYVTHADGSAGQRPVWNTGYWSHLGGQLELSSTDHTALSYDIFLRDGVLTVKDANGCLIEYRR